MTVNSGRRAAFHEGLRLGSIDFTYGHFLYPSGAAAADIAELRGVPAFLGLGESDIEKYEHCFRHDEVAALLGRFRKIVAVSPPIRDLIVERYGVPADRIGVFPNGTNLERFQPRDQMAMRAKYGLPDGFLIAFVGHFIERKGPQRVMEAIRDLPVKAVFVGEGPQMPVGDQVVWAKRADRDGVAELLSACDAFVLPTLAEGSCNAVVEALASGLPVVSSDRDFNRPVLDETNALLVDPQDVGAIRTAVARLVEDRALRDRLAVGARSTAEGLSVDERARRILAFFSTA